MMESQPHNLSSQTLAVQQTNWQNNISFRSGHFYGMMGWLESDMGPAKHCY